MIDEERKIIDAVIEDIRGQFKQKPKYFNRFPHTISLKLLQEKTGISPRKSTHIVRKFLKDERKPYNHKTSSTNNSRYIIMISRKELKRLEKKYPKNYLQL